MILEALRLNWSVNLQAALALLGQELERQGATKAHALCEEIAGSVAETRVTIPVPAVQLFCEACEVARGRGDQELAAKLEALVKALKQGEQRTVVATLGYHLLEPKNIDKVLEDIRGRVLR
jgi:hypothetical protein